MGEEDVFAGLTITPDLWTGCEKKKKKNQNKSWDLRNFLFRRLYKKTENNSTTALWVMTLILDLIVKSNRKNKGMEKFVLARVIWLGSPKKP